MVARRSRGEARETANESSTVASSREAITERVAFRIARDNNREKVTRITLKRWATLSIIYEMLNGMYNRRIDKRRAV